MRQRSKVLLNKKMKSSIALLCIAGVLTSVLRVGIFYFLFKKGLVYQDLLKNKKNYIEKYDYEADYDEDGISNKDEEEIGTSFCSVDSDCDGLTDKYETDESKTSPLHSDTDGDTLGDYEEILAGLNPLMKKSDGKVHDADRKFNETYHNDVVQVSLSGNASIYNTYIGKFDVSGLSNTPGVMSDAYEIYSKKSFENCRVSFSYDETVVWDRGGTIDNLSIYTFGSNGAFAKVKDSTINRDAGTVSATVSSSGKYLLCDSSIVEVGHTTNVMLLIDNSSSMFSAKNNQKKLFGDTGFKRLDMAKAIIENISNNVNYGLGKFTGTYTNLANIGTSKEELFEKIDGIRYMQEVFNGTFIATSIIESLSNFSDDCNERKFIIILTDGKTTENTGKFHTDYDEDDVIRYCNEKNVSVITIGMGENVESSYLQKIADHTGGAYIYANNADALTTLYEKISCQFSYSSEDIDGDGSKDAYVVADSGFSIEKDAFSFENFSGFLPNEGILQNGFCYGIAAFAQGFYQNNYVGAGKGFSMEYYGKKYSVPDFNVKDILAKYKNLHDYENSILDKYKGFYEYGASTKYVCRDQTLYFSEEAKNKFQHKYIKYIMRDGEGVWGEEKFTRYETPIIDIEGYIASGEKDEEMEFICALYWYWAQQIENRGVFDIVIYSLRENFALEVTSSLHSKVIQKLNDGVPLIVSYHHEDGGHAINAVRLLRDIEQPNVYYLECYDNNDNAKLSLMKIEQQDINLWHKNSGANWGKNVSVTSYIQVGDGWENITLAFHEIVYR